ncbi:DUF1127 domain-containing protein [Roseibium sp.]|uniref:DUF1127 domain-containing protein n=1 Tax=Roseibium sp. TaxID=1936156 RepID=UPI003A96A296
MATFSEFASPFEGLSAAFSAAGQRFLAVCEEFGKARAAKALYAELACMTDEELAELGMKRDEISRTVFSKVYDLR